MNVADVVAALERIAPPAYAAEWDNVGLLVGDAAAPCRRALLCVDLTAAVLAEARRVRADLVMAYHPLIFKPLAGVTAAGAPLVWQAVRAGLAVYSVHTAYDAVEGGANDALADALGMDERRRPLEPYAAKGRCKVVTFVPAPCLPAVAKAAFEAGAGHIGNYSQCSFMLEGVGTFFGGEGARPAIGRAGRYEEVNEFRWEVVCPNAKLSAVLAAIRQAHSYEEPAIDVYPLHDAPDGVGLGRVGALAKPASMTALLERVRQACGVQKLLLAGPAKGRVRTLAVGCGSCGGLFRAAVAARADLYVTGELRHHDALAAAAAGLTVACVGHSNSERLTLRPLAERLRKALPGLRSTLSRADVDPFSVA